MYSRVSLCAKAQRSQQMSWVDLGGLSAMRIDLTKVAVRAIVVKSKTVCCLKNGVAVIATSRSGRHHMRNNVVCD